MPEAEIYLKCACRNCGGHIEFPQSGAGATIVCPHCGGSTLLAAPPGRKPALVWVCVLMVAVGGIGVWRLKSGRRHGLQPTSEKIVQKVTAPAVPAPPPDPWHGLMAEPVTLQKAENGGLVYAIGVLRNESSRERFGVKVELDVFDAQDQKIGSATDYTQSIIAGKEWRFKALVIDRKTVRAEVAKVTEQE